MRWRNPPVGATGNTVAAATVTRLKGAREAALAFLTRLTRDRVARRTAIVWLSHFDDPEGDAAFARLAREAARWGRVFRFMHLPQQCPAPDGGDRLSVSDADLEQSMPTRFAEMNRRGGSVCAGFLDLVHLAAMRRLNDFDYAWFIEYDVDFSGSWGAFFSEFHNNAADLLGTTLYPRERQAKWSHWKWFGSPGDECRASEMRGFFPVARFSRRFAQVYAEAVRGGWSGHFEALYPTIALRHGLSAEDIGGEGPMTPQHRRGRLYTNTDAHRINIGTFRYRPPVSSHYFPGCDFGSPAHLWHPIKTRAYAEFQQRPNRSRRAAGRHDAEMGDAGATVD